MARALSVLRLQGLKYWTFTGLARLAWTSALCTIGTACLDLGR